MGNCGVTKTASRWQHSRRQTLEAGRDVGLPGGAVLLIITRSERNTSDRCGKQVGCIYRHGGVRRHAYIATLLYKQMFLVIDRNEF